LTGDVTHASNVLDLCPYRVGVFAVFTTHVIVYVPSDSHWALAVTSALWALAGAARPTTAPTASRAAVPTIAPILFRFISCLSGTWLLKVPTDPRPTVEFELVRSGSSQPEFEAFSGTPNSTVDTALKRSPPREH
jgi:hypothetical protein